MIYFLHRALEDQGYQAAPEMKALAQQVKPYIMDQKPIPQELHDEFKTIYDDKVKRTK